MTVASGRAAGSLEYTEKEGAVMARNTKPKAARPVVGDDGVERTRATITVDMSEVLVTEAERLDLERQGLIYEGETDTEAPPETGDANTEGSAE